MIDTEIVSEEGLLFPADLIPRKNNHSGYQLWMSISIDSHDGFIILNKERQTTESKHCMEEEFEDNKLIIRIRKSKKVRQHNGQKKKNKRQTTTYKTYTYIKEKTERLTPLKTWGEHRCSRRVGSSYSTTGTLCVAPVTNPVISHASGEDREMLISGTHPYAFVTDIP